MSQEGLKCPSRVKKRSACFVHHHFHSPFPLPPTIFPRSTHTSSLLLILPICLLIYISKYLSMSPSHIHNINVKLLFYFQVDVFNNNNKTQQSRHRKAQLPKSITLRKRFCTEKKHIIKMKWLFNYLTYCYIWNECFQVVEF